MNVKPGFQWIAISKDMSLLVLARRLTSNTKKTKKDKELKYKYLHPDHVKKQQFAITILGLENIIIVTTETKKQVKDKYLTNLTKYNVYISNCF